MQSSAPMSNVQAAPATPAPPAAAGGVSNGMIMIVVFILVAPLAAMPLVNMLKGGNDGSAAVSAEVTNACIVLLVAPAYDRASLCIQEGSVLLKKPKYGGNQDTEI
jgi:hypothetical protein